MDDVEDYIDSQVKGGFVMIRHVYDAFKNDYSESELSLENFILKELSDFSK